MSEILAWISQWMNAQCNGDWEHMYGIKIGTTDNPGWYITIDLVDTELEDLEMETDVTENAEDDWFFYKVRDKQYFGAGDLNKLEFLLYAFKGLVEKHRI
ncbi:immunity 53 family protein [Chitinophaga sp.]|uniref:immunity 53 family protein n=1 Tax=Chitinophaga sp. TaxID=1869181 RepID=UPI0031DA168D